MKKLPCQDSSPCRQQVRNKLEKINAMEFGKLHDTTDTMDFCQCQHLTDLLQICYGETGIMDFGKTCYGKLLTCFGLATGKSPTCYRLAIDLSFMLGTC